MSSSTAKRRKIVVSIPTNDASVASASNNEHERFVFHPVSKRPSYASPTKASLARSTPFQIIPPRPSSRHRDAPRSQKRNVQDSTRRQADDSESIRNTVESKKLPPIPMFGNTSYNAIMPNLQSPPRRPVSSSKKKSYGKQNSTMRSALFDEMNAELDTGGLSKKLQEFSAVRIVDKSPKKKKRIDSLFIGYDEEAEDKEEEEPELPIGPEQRIAAESDEMSGGIEQSSPSLRKQRSMVVEVKSSPKEEEITKKPDVLKGTPSLQQEAAEAIIKKRRLRDELASQLQAVQSDVVRLEDVVGKINIGSKDLGDKLELATLITPTDSTTAQPTPEESKPSISSLLSMLLPFSAPPEPNPAPIRDTKDFPSYHPIPLSDPLPHLRAFTPLTFKSTSKMMLKPTLRQVHDITLSSPRNYLIVNLDLCVDVESHSVQDLKIKHLSSWAENELGSWMRIQAASYNVGVLCWAVGRYWEAVQHRGRCWNGMRKKFPNLLNMEHSTSDDKNRRGDESSNSDEDDDDDASSRNAQGVISPSLSPQTLRFHSASSRALVLVVSWRIRITWTGDVENEMDASVTVPGAWKTGDERGMLGKIPELFRGLVKKGGIDSAVDVLVKLLFGEVVDV